MSATLSAALEREHHEIDDIVEDIAQSDPATLTEVQCDGLKHAVTLLRRHIYLEEEFLFPPLREAGMAGPVMVMLHEHGQMWQVLDTLDDLLVGSDPGPATLLCQDLLTQLAAHNMKEERILYPQAETLVPADELAELTRLVDTATLPAEWVCTGAATV